MAAIEAEFLERQKTARDARSNDLSLDRLRVENAKRELREAEHSFKTSVDRANAKERRALADAQRWRMRALRGVSRDGLVQVHKVPRAAVREARRALQAQGEAGTLA